MMHDPAVKGPGVGLAAATAFDPALYPRTYRIPDGRQAVLRRAGGSMALFGLAVTGLAIFGPDEQGFWNSAFSICLWLAMALAGAVCFVRAGKITVTLHPDAAEVVNL